MKRLLIVLVFLLCINLASASLTISAVFGNAGILGYRAPDDTTNINLTSSSQPVTMNNQDCSCSQVSSYYKCVCTDSKQEIGGEVEYLIKNTNNPPDAITTSIKVDEIAPSGTFTITAANGNYTVNYNALDKAYEDFGGCSGINKIEVYENSNNVNTIEINGSKDDCTKTGKYVLSLSESGLVEFYLKIYDNVGNAGETLHVNYTVDVEQPSAENLVFKRNGIELGTISYNHDFAVDVYFDAIEANIASVVVDLSDIHTNAVYKNNYKSINVPVSDCKLNETGRYTCVIRGKTLRLNKDNVNVAVKITDKTGNSNTINLTKSFSIDNNIPSATFLGTDKCASDGKCFVNPGMNKVLTKLSKDMFYNRMVFFAIDSLKTRAVNCTGGECYSLVQFSCASGKVYSLTITSLNGVLSQDDAGNPIQPISSSIYCDSVKPVIKSIEARPSNSDLGEISTQSGMVVELNATEDLGEVKAHANFSNLNGDFAEADCQKKDANWQCIFNPTVNLKPEEFKEGDVYFFVKDTAGNLATATKKIKIYGVTTEPPVNWQLKVTGFSPTKLNKQFNQYIDQKVFVSAKLTQSNPEAKTLRIKEAGCTAKNNGAGPSSIEVLNNMPGSVDPIFVLTFTKGSLDSYTKIEAECNIQIWTKTTKYIYSTPETETFSVQVQLVNVENMADRVKKEMDAVQKDVDKNFKWLSTIDSLVIWGRRYCDITKGMMAVGDLLGGMGTVFSISPDPVSQATAKTLTQAGQSVGDTAQVTHMLPEAGPLCKVLSCDTKIQNAFYDKVWGNYEKLWPGLDKAKNFYGRNGTLFDRQNSLVISTLSGCVPGMINSYKRYQEIDCNYYDCLANGVPQGEPISYCMGMRSYQKCKYVVGEVFQLVPYARIFDDGMKLLKQTISNPIGLLGATLVTTCNKFGKNPRLQGPCLVVSTTSSIQNIVETLKRAKISLAEVLGKDKQKDGSMCDQIRTQSSHEYKITSNCVAQENSGVTCTYNGKKYTYTANGGISKDGSPLLDAKTIANLKAKGLTNPTNALDKINIGELQLNALQLTPQQKEQLKQEINKEIKTAKESKDIPSTDTIVDNLKEEGLTVSKEAVEKIKNGKEVEYDYGQAGVPPDKIKDAVEVAPQIPQIEDADKQYLEQKYSQVTPTMLQAYKNLKLRKAEYDVANKNYQKAKKASDDANKFNKKITDILTKEKIKFAEGDNFIIILESKTDPKYETIKNILYKNKIPFEEDSQGLIQSMKTDKKDKENAKTSAKGASDDAKVKADDEKKKFNAEAFKVTWTGWAGFATSMDVIRGFNYASSFLIPSSMRESWMKKIDQSFAGKYLNLNIQNWAENKYCLTYNKKSGTENMVTIKNDETGAPLNAVRAEGEYNQYTIPGQGAVYDYQLTGRVSAKKAGLQFQVVVDGGNGGYKVVIPTQTIGGETFSFTFPDDYESNFTSPYNFERVCIVFNGYLNEYFDEIHLTDGNKFCNTIKAIGT